MRALRDEESFDIPMTSLIDMVFLLLVFFLVATNFVKKEADHEVRLPDSEAGTRNAPVPDRLVVNVRADGTVVVNGSVADEAELRRRAREFASGGSGDPAVIRGDGRASYQDVMRVFGICRAEGIRRVDLPVLDPERR